VKTILQKFTKKFVPEEYKNSKGLNALQQENCEPYPSVVDSILIV